MEVQRLAVPIWKVTVLALLGLLLLSGCWRADFLLYDDTVHVLDDPHTVPGVGLAETFQPRQNRTYLPVTELSYQLDRMLFESWLPGCWNLGSYASGVRLMTCLYHLLAALALGLVLRRLGLSAEQSFFCAAVFVGHPLMCEVVGWVSERKTALAGMFGFSALGAFLAGTGRRWRMPLAAVLYALALCAKPSALGLLPVFIILEAIGNPEKLAGVKPLFQKSRGEWLLGAARLLPLAALSLAVVWLNVARERCNILTPPGGSVFTALLTDLEILARYLFNALWPLRLSAVYFVEPVRSLFEPRVWVYGALLAGLIALTLWLAPRRRLAALGWLWFVGGSGPALNLIAFAHLMQDRYLYFSLPGFLLVLVEAMAGLQARLELKLRFAAAGYVVLLALLAALRSPVWRSTHDIFLDAAAKQPRAAFAHYGLACAYAEAARRAPQRAGEYRRLACAQWERALQCSDAARYGSFSEMALNVGDEYYAQHNEEQAQRYWLLGAYPPPETPDRPEVRAEALSRLKKLNR